MSSHHDTTTHQRTQDTFMCSIFDGRLGLIRVLGQGSFGTVYLAKFTTDNDPQHYAVKCMPRYESSHSMTEIQALEIAAHKDVSDHPNVVNIHDVGGDKEEVHVVMDYCEGGDMYEAIYDGLYENNDELIKEVFVQLIDAVHHCHERGVFHRDLKPANVLLATQSGDSIRLADFGLASTKPTSSEFVGSQSYMSPEGHSASTSKPFCLRANDVWALGIVLFKLITTGGRPWNCASSDDEEFNAYIQDSNILREMLPTITDAAFELIVRIFDVDPTTRIQLPEIRKMVLSLDNIFQKRPIQPPPIPRKPLHLIAPKRVDHVVQPKPAPKIAPTAVKSGKALKEDFAWPAVAELKERLFGNAVVPTGDGFLIAVT